jgi:hypothetical protein
VSSLAPVPASLVAELRRTRRKQRVATIHWIDALYQVYITALAVVAAILTLSSVIGDEPLSAEAVRRVADDGPAVLGLVAAFAIGVGIRSGCRGGPLAVEAADVRHVLLAPVDRAAALRGPALRQLRFAAFAAAGVGATVGQFAGRRMSGHGAGPAWVLCGALFGAVVVGCGLGAALVASSRRVPTWIGSLLAAAIVGLAVADVVDWLPWSPTEPVGSIGVWPLDFDPLGLVAIAVGAAVVAIGLAGVAGISLEQAERRTALVGQVRFAVTLQDLRTVMVLRRQLAADQPRIRPWIALRRHSRFPIWQRGWRGVLRYPVPRLIRMVMLSVAAALALRGVWAGTTPLLVAAGIALWVAALDAVEPLAQEIDHPSRAEALPYEKGDLLVRHLPVSIALMIPLAAIGVGAAALAGASGDELTVLALAIVPLALASTAGAVISVLMGAPKPVSEFALATPEIAGAKIAVRTIWPPLVAVSGAVPVWVGLRASEAGDDPVPVVLLTTAVVLTVAINTAAWVHRREAIHLWWQQTKDAAMGGAKPGDRDAGDDDEPPAETPVKSNTAMKKSNKKAGDKRR